MTTLARPVALAFAAVPLGSISPAQEPSYSAELLAYLDPTTSSPACAAARAAAGRCGPS